MTRARRFFPSTAALLAALTIAIPPAPALAAPGDLVLRKSAAAPGARASRPVAGTFAGASGIAPAPTFAPAPATLKDLVRRRATFPHEIVAPGFDPARQVTSAGRRRVDLFQTMRERAQRRSAFGPESVPAAVRSFPGEDTIRVALLRIDFRNDRGGDQSSGDGKFDLSPRDSVNRPLDPTPHDRAFFVSHGEALTRYYRDQMGGRVVMEFTVYPSAPDSAFHLSDMADYGPWKFSTEIYGAAVKLFQDCLNAADTTESIPWGTFDRVCIIHAGSDLQSDVNADSPEDIPTFTIGVADTDAVALGPTKSDTVFAATIAPETIRQDGYEGTLNAVLAHEFGHLVFGWRDVYDVQSGLPTVGYWSLMDVGNLVGNAVTFPSGTQVYATGILPPAVDPWQKRLVYDDMPAAPEPPYGQDALLPDIEENYTVFKVPMSGEEYLLLENRLDDLNGNGQLSITRDAATGVILGPSPSDTLEYDFLVPGPGCLAWHVDESVADFFGSRADPGFGLNVNRSRFGLQIIEADGLDDLGDFNSPYALGTVTDPWWDTNGGRLNDTTVPKLQTNSETDPHLDIQFFSLPGPAMTLRVTRLWDLAGWPVKATQPPSGITPVTSPLGPAPNVRIAWAGGDSAVHVRNFDGSPMVPGAPDDVVLRANAPLRPVAVVARDAAYGGPFLAVAEDVPAGGGGSGKLYLVRFTSDGHVASTETVVQPAPVTAGPASGYFPSGWSGNPDPALPPTVFTGLADGRVIANAFSGVPGAETVTATVAQTMSGAVAGLCALSPGFVAASRGGDLATDSRVGAGVLTPNHEWQPLVYARQSDPGPATICISGGCMEIRLVAVDRTAGELRAFNLTQLTPLALEQSHVLGEPIGAPSLDDVDGDGLPEIAFATESGKVGYWNDNGSLSPGWPPEVEREGFPTRAGVLPLERGGESGLLLASLGNGRLTVLDDRQKAPAGFPLGLSVGARGTGVVDDELIASDGPPVLFIAGGDSLLYGFQLPTLVSAGRPATSTWPCEGGAPGRGYCADRVFGVDASVSASAKPILEGTFKCYPNPARQSPVTFAFRLREAGKVTFKIFDPAAREVDSFTRDANASDNAIVWDPGSRPSGLYLARVEAAGQVLTQPFAILR